MEIKDSGSVILTAYHSHTPARIQFMEKSFAPELSPGCSSVSRKGRLLTRMLSHSSLQPPFNRSISQDSMDSTSMEDFWSEVNNIKENSENGQEEQTLVEDKPAEGELEAEWLQEVGLSTLISGADAVDEKALLSTLTRTQAAAVQKRYDTYTQTLRKKNRASVRDVRDIFRTSDSSPAFDTASTSPAPTNGVQMKKRAWKSLRESCTGDSELKKERPVEAEVLYFEVSYSECITTEQKEWEQQASTRIKKDDATLPKFVVQKTKLGLTRVGDLSPQDMKKIGYFSLIELAAFFDALRVELKRHRAVRIKVRENGLFGVPLRVLLENDQKKVPGTKVPLILQKLLSKLEETGLQTEGILRVPGSASRVKNLRQDLEAKFYEDTFDWDQVRHNDAAGLLKMFIRELPYPLLTVEYQPAFLSTVESISQTKLQLQGLHLLIMLLPEANRNTLKALLEFLCKVVANEEKNRMSLWNVSMIVAPNLFMYKRKGANQQEMQAAARTAHIVRLLIKYQEILWTVPSFLISQVRKMNEAAMSNNRKHLVLDKSMRKLLKKMNIEYEKPDRVEPPRTDIPEGVIRVQAPLHSKVSMAIQLKCQTKARDILARFHCENRCSQGSSESAQSQNHCLYEIGGNIGERCLDLDTYIFDLYRVNPHAEWVIKPKTT
ncbi:rho GTPase-activating protein 28 [Latimeria chalumnae]|uniref:rho GTPase-activating protein 28 n=1 Tax=Latimeria chalumnae TaxID=7897 RepID=UPI0006D8F2E6|nr:PREDICTED: rho GTPase-activating protein 28 [Latimeria chalumnae]|eukprot:XP_014351034.1 PREDICTED: rho GTPase-activating protein 28 [Latimeria chalumnae]